MKSLKHLILLACLAVSLIGLFQGSDRTKAQSVIVPEATATFTHTPSVTPLATSTSTPTPTSLPPTATAGATSTGTITAAPTDTPSLTPSITATLDPSVTPPTATPEPVELLANGGFENPGASGKLAADWTLKHAGFARRKCNKTSPPKVYAFSGACAYLFKGGSGARTGIIQKPAVMPVPGDTLTFSGQVQGKNTTEGGRMQLRLKYLDDTRAKLNLPITTGTYAYTLMLNTLPVTQTVIGVRVQLRTRSISGKFLIDDVSLLQSH